MSDTSVADTVPINRTQPRLKQKYRTEISAQLKKDFGFTNVHQVPSLVKIVVNTGVGEAARDGKVMDGAVRDLAAITGQKPQVTSARKSIAQFKLREGQPIGAHVTLRGDRAWEFLDRLLSLALPRIRDFRGLSDKQFDGQDRPRARFRHHRRYHGQDRRRRPRAAQSARVPVPYRRIQVTPIGQVVIRVTGERNHLR